MKVFRRRFIRVAFQLRKWRKLISNGAPISSTPYEYLQRWAQDVKEAAAAVPKDVPRGHMVVYVGEDCRRFVIRVDFLQHPLFRDLLDRAQEEYEFSSRGRWGLCLPCDESSFMANLRQIAAALQQGRRLRRLCL